MMTKCLPIAVLAAATVVLQPSPAFSQMDPSQNNQMQQNANPVAPAGQMPTGQNGTQPAQQTMRDTLGAPGENGQQMLDKKFLENAAKGGIAEVKLGELAVQKGSPDVKAFGQKMVDDHTAINKDMAEVADELGVMLPKKMSKEDQAEYDKLNKLSGDAFDKEFILAATKAHRQDLHDFRTEASVAADPGLSTEVVKASLVIRQHLTMLLKLAQDKGVTLPPRQGQRPTPAPAGQ
jgi:putative membrane protein